MHTLERLVLETAAVWEKEGVAHGEIRPVIVAVDETFLQRLMLVFMDLVSGYVLMEEGAVDRTYDTWYDFVNGRLKTFGTEVLSLVSDRVNALVKLAHTGLGCLSIPAVFHLSYDLAKSSSLSILNRLRHAKQALEQTRQRLEALQSARADGVRVEQTEGLVAPGRPRRTTGRACAVPIGSTEPTCPGFSIPGDWWTRPPDVTGRGKPAAC